METHTRCPSCGAVLRIPQRLVGKQGKCPKCATVVTLGELPQPEPSDTGPVKKAVMPGKRVAAVAVFLLGGLVGGSTRTNLWDSYPFWVWLIVLMAAFGLCGTAVNMWRSGVLKKDDK